MATIYLSLRGSPTAGGPTVAAYRLAQGFSKKKHKVIYDHSNQADVCLCIIESGKTLRQVDRNKTKICVRLDGAYFKEYWHSKTPDRMWRADMTALHAAIKRDVGKADHMIYQSAFSKSLIDAEIAERKDRFSIINNGVDTNIFIPRRRKDDGFINLFHHGVMRNDYLMESLMGAYNGIKAIIPKTRLILVGSMDSQCSKIYNYYKPDKNIIYFGSIQNSKLPQIFENADIGIYPRQGSSNDNAVIEGISSGIPVVIPSWGGNSEIINDGRQGIIVSSGHWDYGPEYIKKLTDGIEKIIPDLAGFKFRAREHAVKNLTIDIMIEKYLKAMGL